MRHGQPSVGEQDEEEQLSPSDVVSSSTIVRDSTDVHNKPVSSKTSKHVFSDIYFKIHVSQIHVCHVCQASDIVS